MNKVIMEIEDKILDEVENWWDIVQLDYDDNKEYLKCIYAEVPKMNIGMKITLPCEFTNFHYRLEADYLDAADLTEETGAVDIWYDTIDDLLENLKSTKVHAQVYDWYDLGVEEE